MEITRELNEEVRKLCEPICRREARSSSIQPDQLVDEVSNQILFRLWGKEQVTLDRYVRKTARLDARKLCRKSRQRRQLETDLSALDETKSSRCRWPHRSSILDEVIYREELSRNVQFLKNTSVRTRRGRKPR